MINIIIKELNGKEIADKLQKDSRYNVVAYTDKYPHNVKAEENELPVISTFEAIKKYKNKQVDYFFFSMTIGSKILEKMVEELLVLGVEQTNIFVVLPEYIHTMDSHDIVCWSEFTYLPYIEYHIADHCNLNCKGCVHFSPLVQREKMADFDGVKSDLFQLKKLVSHIYQIRILGGEPLLNKELPRYLEITRKVYPHSQISIVTNGLLLRKMSAELIHALKEYEIDIDISLYKPIYDQMENIMNYLRENELKFTYSSPIEKFAYTFDLQGGHANGVEQLSCTCPNLYEGKLYICPIIAYIKYYNDAMHTSISHDEGAIDIYDSKMTYEKLKHRLHEVVPICDKCLYISHEKQKLFNWEQTSGINQDDYVWNSTE